MELSSLERSHGEMSPASFGYEENRRTRHRKSPNNAQHVKRTDLAKKRRRILHACDECRRKKIKCDGTEPCTHCAVYSYECTYNDPSKRGRVVSIQQLEVVEARLQKTETLLHLLEPNLDLDDLYLDKVSPEQIASTLHQRYPSPSHTRTDTTLAGTVDDTLLGTMMGNFGSLDLDDKGRWIYNGHSSTTIFMQRLQNQFGNLIGSRTAIARYKRDAWTSENPGLGIEQLQDATHRWNFSLSIDLPQEVEARKLCRASLDEACVFNQIVHEPTFWTLFDHIYAAKPEKYGAEERAFLPLLYAVMAVGCLFLGTDDQVPLPSDRIRQGFQFFKACQELLDLTDCRDLTSIQAIIFMVMFLQSSAPLADCYPYLGIAHRAALRLGLHRKIQTGTFDPIECELRKRIFWVIRSMDACVSIRLGLPISIDTDDIDQDYPLELDDKCITPAGLLPMPFGRVPRIAAANAHASLAVIVVTIVKNVYPVKLAKYQEKLDKTYMIRYAKIKKSEADLQTWMDQLPAALRSEDDSALDSPIIERMGKLLLLAHAHAQWILYRPFLHFASEGFQNEGNDRRPYICAAACLNASRRVIQIASSMHKKGLLNSTYWFPIHAIYYATLTLIYSILENREGQSLQQDTLESAHEGTNILKALAKNSLILGICPGLHSLFEHFSEKIPKPSNHSDLTIPNKERQQLQREFSCESAIQRSQSMTSPALPSHIILDQPTISGIIEEYHFDHENSDQVSLFLQPELDSTLANGNGLNALGSEGNPIFDEILNGFDIDMSYMDV